MKPETICTIAGITGATLASVGAGMIYLPSGVILAGALLLAGAIAWARRL